MVRRQRSEDLGLTLTHVRARRAIPFGDRAYTYISSARSVDGREIYLLDILDKVPSLAEMLDKVNDTWSHHCQ
jgi:hypothetical protein